MKRCLVLVPHQDDETMLAGNIIRAMRKAGVEVFVLYSTNGDWKYPADVRIKEAASALKCIGSIPKNHIILLGYGDTYNNESHTHYYYAGEKAVQSASGHMETYGAYGITDYRYKKSGFHSPYTRQSFVNDLKDAISDIRPDVIICIDFDEHPDHRMLSLGLDEAFGQILREEDYHPLILKGFSYCNAYTAIDDFDAKPLQETKRPKLGQTEKYKFDMIDTSIYQWNERIRIYAGQDAKRHLLIRNTKAKALRKHTSQHVILRAGRIINADEVFWMRRSDSISYEAQITVSSGEGKYLNDFRLYNCNEIDSEIPDFCDYLWIPGDEKKEALFSWAVPQEIDACNIYGNLNTNGSIRKIRLVFDNGYRLDAGPLPKKGTPLRISFEKQKVSSVILKIVEQEGTGCGIAECEFFTEDNKPCLDEFLQFSADPEEDPHESLALAKAINACDLATERVRKQAGRLYWLIRRKGVKGLVKKFLRKA